MISIKEYLELTDTVQPEAVQTQTGKAHPAPDESSHPVASAPDLREQQAVLPVAVAAYRSALVEMGNCGQSVCPALGGELKQGLGKLEEKLLGELSCERVAATESGVREQLQGWGRRVALHGQKQTNEVKDILLVMARTAESVGMRDQRCAEQITEVTTRLKGIANLEDLTQIRESIKKSATELKGSIDRMKGRNRSASGRGIKLPDAAGRGRGDCLAGCADRSAQPPLGGGPYRESLARSRALLRRHHRHR
jgi:hypothetical protein